MDDRMTKQQMRTKGPIARNILSAVLLLCLIGGSASGSALPFVETFEALTDGVLNGQNAWTTTPATVVAEVQTNTVYAASKAMSMSNAVVEHPFSTPAASNAWVDFYVQAPLRGKPEQPTPDSNTSAAFYFSSLGRVVVLDGASWRTLSGYTVSSTAWVRITLNLNYDTRKWAIYASAPATNALAVTLATNLAFQTTATNTAVGRFRVTGSDGQGHMDSFSAVDADANGIPRNIDGDGDQLSDRWELANIGNLSSNALSDSDGDGLINLYEFWAGTDPLDSNDVAGIIDADLLADSSSDIEITIRTSTADAESIYAGDTIYRSLNVRSVDADAGLSKVIVDTLLDDLSGSNQWTDANVVGTATRRYYDISFAYAGNAFTNTEEWAVYVQDRKPSWRYLISVPVDYGSTNENSLAGRLGEHIGRGLFASTVPGNGDRAYYIDPTHGSWKEFFFTTNASGGARFWYDMDSGTNADVVATPGMGWWVQRSASSGTRSNSVFVGRSYTDVSVEPIAVTTNDDGWNMVGWPLAQSKTHSRTDAIAGVTNQLGFAALSQGGRSDANDRASEWGDQIWVWQNNAWWAYYWLVEEVGAAWDGRWWDTHTRNFADFSLEPGMAVYYLHPTNQWGPTNFVWTPSVP